MVATWCISIGSLDIEVVMCLDRCRDEIAPELYKFMLW